MKKLPNIKRVRAGLCQGFVADQVWLIQSHRFGGWVSRKDGRTLYTRTLEDMSRALATIASQPETTA